MPEETLETKPCIPIREVHIDGLAQLKIIRHCHESYPDMADGTLLGIDNEGVINISNCFPQPNDGDNPHDDQLQINMIKALTAVNIVGNSVGWYQAIYFYEYLTADFIHDHYQYQSVIPNSVCITYNPYTVEKGRLPFTAIRLTKSFMELYASGKFIPKNIQKYSIKSSNIFEEIPIQICNSVLDHAYIYELTSAKLINGINLHECLNTNNTPLINKLIDLISGTGGCIDEFSVEQEKYRASQLASMKQKLELAKRIEYINSENESRAKWGREQLPLPDMQPLSKIPEQSRLESLLITSRIDLYGREIANLAYNTYTNQSILSAFVKSSIENPDIDDVENTEVPIEIV